MRHRSPTIHDRNGGEAFIEDAAVRAFMAEANPAALRETAARLAEALERGLWKPRSNSAGLLLAQLMEA